MLIKKCLKIWLAAFFSFVLLLNCAQFMFFSYSVYIYISKKMISELIIVIF